MSFTSEVRSETMKNPERKKCCQKAELLGITLFGDAMRGGEWTYLTENEDLKKHIAVLFKWAFSLRESVTIDAKKVFINNPGDTLAVLSELQLLGRIGASETLLSEDCCKRAFVRGAFLATGTVSDPEKEYRLEFMTKKDTLCRMLCEALEAYRLHPKISMRNGRYVIYFKKEEEISDVLKMLNAPQGVWKLMDAKIQKDCTNAVNRRMNCDMANINKTMQTSEVQRMAIASIRENGMFSRLPEILKEMAKVREEYPEASMADLGAIMGISKGAVSNRLKKLMEYADWKE